MPRYPWADLWITNPGSVKDAVGANTGISTQGPEAQDCPWPWKFKLHKPALRQLWSAVALDWGALSQALEVVGCLARYVILGGLDRGSSWTKELDLCSNQHSFPPSHNKQQQPPTLPTTRFFPPDICAWISRFSRTKKIFTKREERKK